VSCTKCSLSFVFARSEAVWMHWHSEKYFGRWYARVARQAGVTSPTFRAPRFNSTSLSSLSCASVAAWPCPWRPTCMRQLFAAVSTNTATCLANRTERRLWHGRYGGAWVQCATPSRQTRKPLKAPAPHQNDNSCLQDTILGVDRRMNVVRIHMNHIGPIKACKQ